MEHDRIQQVLRHALARSSALVLGTQPTVVVCKLVTDELSCTEEAVAKKQSSDACVASASMQACIHACMHASIDHMHACTHTLNAHVHPIQSPCMHAHIHPYIIRTCTKCTYASIQAGATCMHPYNHMHASIRPGATCMHPCNQGQHTCIHTIRTSTHACMHAYMHPHKHTYMHARTHACAHAHIQAPTHACMRTRMTTYSHEQHTCMHACM
jgi:hypothetical protein